MPQVQRVLRREHGTNPLIWLAAVVCAIITVAVIITGIFVIAVYFVYKPKMPDIKVNYTQLLHLDYDRTEGTLATQMIINMVAHNDNKKAKVSFSDISFILRFRQLPIALLRADPFDVSTNESSTLNYVVNSAAIPLDKVGREDVELSIKRDLIFFNLRGKAKTRWSVGVFASLKFLADLNCKLQFLPSNGSSVDLDCNTITS